MPFAGPVHYMKIMIMGIDLVTWRARIGLNYYHKCRPLQTRWRSRGGQLYQPGVVRGVINGTLVLKGCMIVSILSLILQYVVQSLSMLKGRSGVGKIRCHWRSAAFQVRKTVEGGGTLLLLGSFMAVVPLLLVMAGDVELNPGPGGIVMCTFMYCPLHLCLTWLDPTLPSGIIFHKLTGGL